MTGTAGERFAQALAAKDREALTALLDPAVDFQALTPGRHWQSGDPAEVVDQFVLGHWFGPAAEIRGLRMLADRDVARRRHVAYQLRVRREGADYLVEQQVYYELAAEGRIGWVRLLCAGYQPEPPATVEPSAVLAPSVVAGAGAEAVVAG
ncbi:MULTISPECIES: hypothetical protein [Streptacidiphilus]|uniref:Nuclear transport factor 2 family protein n=1 Tax=Streptacidiphilus cavernicola TaxID=3342716 RepID=A0ABV6UVW3_9ACTN|nr:hypothetical protein [Streptacidiphilus jeojiense]